MLAVGHARESRERLALGTGAHDDDLVLGQVADLECIDQVALVDLEIAQLARHAGVREHRATGHDDLAVALLGGVADLLQTMDMARERGHEHAARGVLDGMEDLRSDLGLGLGEARNRGVGGVGEQKVDPLLGELADRRVVGGHAVDRRLVELEVARVEHRALRCLDEDAERAGDRVRHREEVERDAAEVHVAAVLDLAELGRADAELGEFALDEAERQLAREDGDLAVEVLKQVREGAGVVLMAVRDDDAAELVLVLEHVGVVGEHQVDTGLGVIGEHEAGVDQDHVVPALEDGHVLADAVESTQGDDAQRRGFLVCHSYAENPFSLVQNIKSMEWTCRAPIERI